jgi:hypothetical protein
VVDQIKKKESTQYYFVISQKKLQFYIIRVSVLISIIKIKISYHIIKLIIHFKSDISE